MAPMSWAWVPSQKIWLAILCSSLSRTRMAWARGRNFYPQELLHGQNVGKVIRHAGHIIQPVGQGNTLMVSLALGQLLQTPVEETDVRRGLDHHLPVQLQDDPQHAVGAGVWGPMLRIIVSLLAISILLHRP